MATYDPKGKKTKDSEEGEEDDLLDVMPGRSPKREYGFNARSSMIHKLIDVGLLAANFGQLKVVVSSDANQFYHTNLVLIALSICLQLCFLACMIVIWYYEYKFAEFMKERDEMLESQKQQSETNNQATTSAAKKLEAMQGKIQDKEKRLLFWNITGFVLMAVIVVLNVCLSVFFGGSNVDSSTENIGKTRYIGVINGTLQVIE
ncbi:uncharacterized protein LOC128545965 [Mercenaria mercenaria]|uniref:uncharacterized protein LOC128545965 n=1 Tax=Mercenaria mercenaria TaxID=6596 RepID=UPI00234E85D0|nr:uncharacterized protein LOC128545965 [Mercenaria mercenaria]